MPLPQPVDLYRQKLDLLPALQLFHALSEIRSDLQNAFPERLQAVLFHLFKGTLPDNESRLEVVAARDKDQHFPVIDISQQLLGIVRFPADTKPKHVDRDSHLDYVQL